MQASIRDRIELLSEESNTSAANIDPCLISTENAPRLTDINMYYPQRVYCRHNVANLKSAREIVAYSDYALLWEDEFQMNKRVKNLTGIV